MFKKLPKLRAHIDWKEGVNEESQTCEVLQLDFYNDEITALTVDPEDGFESHWHVSLDSEYSEVTILWDEFFKQMTAENEK